MRGGGGGVKNPSLSVLQLLFFRRAASANWMLSLNGKTDGAVDLSSREREMGGMKRTKLNVSLGDHP